MIVAKPTTIRIAGVTYDMRAGTIVPAPVLTYWKTTGELARLQTSGVVSDGAAGAGQDVAAEPKRQGKKKDDVDPV